jgi:hypothetical protein
LLLLYLKGLTLVSVILVFVVLMLLHHLVVQVDLLLERQRQEQGTVAQLMEQPQQEESVA